MPLVLVLNPQNWLIVPSSVWRNGHDPPPQAALPVPVFELSHLIGWPARVVHAPQCGREECANVLGDTFTQTLPGFSGSDEEASVRRGNWSYASTACCIDGCNDRGPAASWCD